MLVADINDDCLLGVDFFRAANLKRVFDSVLGVSEQNKFQNFACLRLESFVEKIPQTLKELSEESSKNLNFSQKAVFASFLSEFQDVFSEDVVAGNCGLVEHEINLSNSCAIKQTPRRIPISMREEVNKIIEEMKEQGILSLIEE